MMNSVVFFSANDNEVVSDVVCSVEITMVYDSTFEPFPADFRKSTGNKIMSGIWILFSTIDC